jgi:hypothetical protein
MKKGQTESIGLVIIVILVLTGLFIMTTNKGPEQSPLETYSDDKLATNYLSSMLETDTACGPTINKLASECAKEQAGRNTKQSCNEPACDYIKPIIEDITNKTFTPQGRTYAFQYTYTYGGEEEDLLSFDTGCGKAQAQAAKGYYDVVIHPAPGTATITFSLCT